MHERTLDSRTIFEGRILSLEVLGVELEDGTRTRREIIRHRGAVAAVARLPDGRFLLVRQYRKPVEQIVTEVVAGTLETGEDPDLCVRREIGEETGHRATSIHRLGHIHPSPGYLDERIVVYAADVEPGNPDHEQDHDERVETVIRTADEINAMIRAGRITDAKTISCWHLYQDWTAHREEAHS